MIEVKSAKKVQTPGKERLTAMDGLRQTVTAIPKRKIGMAMMALFGLVAYIKTLLGGSEVAAQAAPDTPISGDDNAAPICETDNSSADNSGRMSYGNAALFQASSRDEDEGAILTSPQSSPSSVLSPAGSGLQPERFDASGLQPAPLNFQPSAFATTPEPGLEPGPGTDPGTPPSGGGGPGTGTGGGGTGGGDGTLPPAGPDPEDENENEDGPQDPPPSVNPPVEDGPNDDDDGGNDGKDDAPCKDNAHGEHDAACEDNAPGDHDAPRDDHAPCDNDSAEGDPCDDVSSDCASDADCDTASDCDTTPECDADHSCDPIAGIDADCFEDPMQAARDITFGLSTDDDLSGTDADDLIHAGDGADTVLGGAGDDLLIGAAGDDILTGGSGNDRLAGEQGNDTLDGGVGDDILTGGAGNDILWDGTGADLLFGDAGNDTIQLAADDASDTVDGGDGIDTLDLSGTGQQAHIDIAAGTITRPGLPQDSFAGIEVFAAGAGKEVFDLSGFFSPGATATPLTAFQITDFGHDDTLVLTDDIHLALSDLHAVTDTRDIRKDSSDFEARISVFDPETVAETHGRPGFRQDDEDALMIRRIELRQEHETGEIEIDLWISGPDRESDPSQDFTS